MIFVQGNKIKASFGPKPKADDGGASMAYGGNVNPTTATPKKKKKVPKKVEKVFVSGKVINKKGKPASHVSWRLQEKNNKCKISIVISPYLYNQRGKIINFLPFFIFIKPSLTKYLKSVVGGLKWYAEEGLVVQKNQFGKHPWFS